MEKMAEIFPDRITSWSDLAGLVEHFSYFNGHAWLFRGVPDAKYGLISKIGREKTRAEKYVDGKHGRVPYRLEDERAVFSMFIQQARAHLSVSPQSELEWLAIAQHHGMPTRLLDWTDSLLVAAWFAVERGGAADKGDSAIWVARGIPSISLDDPGDAFSVADARCYRPPHMSPRIAAQGSVLVLCPEPTKEMQPPFVQKILIAPSAEFTIKKRLNACGINRRQLFPDLEGLSQHLDWMYKHDWLAGYRLDCASSIAPADVSPAESEE